MPSHRLSVRHREQQPCGAGDRLAWLGPVLECDLGSWERCEVRGDRVERHLRQRYDRIPAGYRPRRSPVEGLPMISARDRPDPAELERLRKQLRPRSVLIVLGRG